MPPRCASLCLTAVAVVRRLEGAPPVHAQGRPHIASWPWRAVHGCSWPPLAVIISSRSAHFRCATATGMRSRRAFHFQRQLAVIRGDSNPSVTTPKRLGDSFQFPLLFHEHVMRNNFGLAYGVAGPESTVTSLMRRRAAPAPGLLAPHDDTREPKCDDHTDATHCEIHKCHV